MNDDIFKPRGMCQHCHKRKATVTWVGEGGTLAMTHGMFEYWCRRCVLEAQITFAEKHVGDLERLRKELADYEKRH